MDYTDHRKVTGFSGNEIYCLKQLGYKPGPLCIGNNVMSLGVVRGIGAGLSTLAGGEITEITQLIYKGRKNAYERMLAESRHHDGTAVAGITFDLINHGANMEFLTFGSTVWKDPTQSGADPAFTAYSDAQQLYCQIDSGFTPHNFVFGNIAYSIGVGGGIKGFLRGLKRGEVPQFTEIFDKTRHLALHRIKAEAKQAGANAVVGIKTTITPVLGTQEMLMMGTAATHPALSAYANDPVTSSLTNEEMWNLVHIGYLPISLVMGVSVYALGFTSGLLAAGKTIAGGEVSTLTELLYEAREKAFARAEKAADDCGADEIVGVKTYVYDMGGGLVEILAIGTAVKKFDGVTTRHDTLPAQAIIQNKEIFVQATQATDVRGGRASKASARRAQRGPLAVIGTIILIIFYVWLGIHNGGRPPDH